MTAVDFEKLISRVIRQLVESGARVIWNDRIPDPDNPGRFRQVDIVIDRDGQKTHIECRNHKTPQDVQWIEELIGRRASLGAMSMLAVSSSGFTIGAIRKAERFGIFLHELSELTPDQVNSWGSQSTVEVLYFRLDPLWLHLLFNKSPTNSMCLLVEALQKRHDYVDVIFNAIKYRLNEGYGDFHYPHSFSIEGHPGNMELLGESIISVVVRGTVTTWKKCLKLPVVYSFSKLSPAVEIMAHVEKIPSGKIEIIKAGTKSVVQMDMSSVPIPEPNSIFSGVVEFDFHRPMQPPNFQLIGSPEQPFDISRAMLVVSTLSE